MAEKAAHFSITSETKPSIFQIIAQNSLNVTLHPAFQKISEFLTECNSTYLGWLTTYQEESFLIFSGLLQYYYLKKHDASFAEYFYGLRREHIKGYFLSNKQKYSCLLFLVVLPYLKRKLEERLAVYRIENAEGLLGNDWKSQSKKVLLHSQSTLEITWNVWLLLNYLRYMSDQTESQNPILALLRLKLVYANESGDDIYSFWSDLFMGKLSFKEFSAGALKNGLRTFLEIGAFLIQFLQTWYKEKPNYSITALPVCPPPQPDPNAASYRGKCPICLQSWKIPTILPVSGYVFCFSCIVKHLREEQRCPVTNYPAQAMDIVRLYDT